MKALIIAAVALTATTTVASAQSGVQHRIDRREAVQETRIQQGLRTGDLTRHEARRLEAEQARIRDMEARARRDGRIDRREAHQIERAQDAASRHIAEERTDSQRRGAWHKRWW
ncbi:MAG: hypothetical protein AB7O57_24050 [Hyphomicrobiaceae bacterium]